MKIRHSLATVAIAGGALLLSSAPAFAGSSGGSESTLANAGSNGNAQNALVFAGGAGVIAGGALVLVRRRSGARA
jgi:hypothetical protein